MPFRVGHSLQLFFADHMLDNDRHELRRGSETVAVEPQVFDLLLYLCRTVIAARAQPNISLEWIANQIPIKQDAYRDTTRKPFAVGAWTSFCVRC